LPSYLSDWLEVLVAYPAACIIVLGITLLFYRTNNVLRDLIADRGRSAWFGATAQPAGWWMSIARAVRTSKLAAGIEFTMSRVVWPAAASVAILAVMVIVSSRITVSYRSGNGDFCNELQERTAEFEPDRLCWASGIKVVEGRRYTIWIDMAEDEPFLDRSIMTDIAGFSDGLIHHVLARPIRRWWSADWFQPIARINAGGIAEWPLHALDGTVAPELLEHAVVADDGGPTCSKLGADALKTTLDRRKKEDGLRRTFVSQFEAPASGELYLYLNDAIFALPFLPTVKCFYSNNYGRAKVTVLEVPPPPKDAPVMPTATSTRGR
jgi:hypothetical protein